MRVGLNINHGIGVISTFFNTAHKINFCGLFEYRLVKLISTNLLKVMMCEWLYCFLVQYYMGFKF